MEFDNENITIWNITKCVEDDDQKEIDIDFFDTGNNVGGKLSLIISVTATHNEIPEAINEEYSNGHYEDLDNKSKQELIDWYRNQPRKFSSIRDLGVWIAENTETKKDQKSIKHAAYWFVAMREASTMYDNDTKSIAHALLYGIEKLDGDEEHVEEWIGWHYEDEQNSVGNNLIITLLKQHFGIKE